jgi:DNA-directed RNA polymerase specialized sigma24 family protein
LLRIARNAAIDQARRQRARPAAADWEDAARQPGNEDPAAAAIRADEHRRLRELVRALCGDPSGPHD